MSSGNLMAPRPGMDTCLLRQLRSQVNNMHSELADITHKTLSSDSGEEVTQEKPKVKKVLLKIDLKVERLLQEVKNSHKISKAEAPRIRLPKISVLSFNGNILNWNSFWEQFQLAVDTMDAVKDSPVKYVFEGL